MAEPFVGEIRMFASNFAPRGWALCDGQLLAISQNDALFALFGTIYGGDGRTTFGLPDLRGRVPIHWGQGPGLTNRPLGQKAGNETVTLTVNQLPVHTHVLNATDSTAEDTNPVGHVTAQSTGPSLYGDVGPRNMADEAILPAGSQAHANMMPFQVIHFIVALFGIFPSRN